MKRISVPCINLFSCITLSLLALTPVTYAQDSVLEEVVVTARQREEKLTDVPASITAFTEGAIDRAGIERAEDFIGLTPGVSMVDAAEVGDAQVSIRGINGSRDAEANFAFIVDGILYTNPSAFNREFADLKQIEILKGPQGAIYGRSAAAGAVIVTTLDPADEFSGKLKASAGENSAYYTSAAVSGPLGGQLKGRLHADYRKTDGFYNNEFLGQDDVVDDFENYNINGRLLWEPTDNLSVDVRGHYGEVDAAAITFNAAFALADAATFLGFPPLNENVNDHDFIFQFNRDPSNEQESMDFSVKVDYDMEWATLTSWMLYSDIEQNFLADGTSGAFGFFSLDFTPISSTNPEGGCFASISNLFAQGVTLPAPQFLGPDPFPPTFLGPYTPTTCDGYQYQVRNQKDISFEMRLTSPSDQDLRWQGGFYYLDLEREVGVAQLRDDGRAVLPESLINPLTEALVYDQFDTTVYAVFGQLAYDVTDTIEVSAAVRYDREEREVSSKVPAPSQQRSQFIDYTSPFMIFPLGASVCPDGLPGSPLNPAFIDFSTCTVSETIPDRDETFEQVQPKVSLRWDMNDNVTMFSSWGVGFKSGGFNNQGSQALVDLFYNTPLLDPVAVGGAGAGAGLSIRDSFREETSNAFEVGFKSVFLDGRLKMEGAMFHTIVDDMQIFNFFVGPFGLLRVVSNIDEVKITGGEFGLAVQMTDYTNIYGGVGVTNSRIEKNSNRPQTVGNSAPYSPDFTAHLGGEYIKPAFSGIDFVGRLDYSIVGPTWFSTVQEGDYTPNLFTALGFGRSLQTNARRGTFGLVNLRMGLQSESWGAHFAVHNLMDKEYLEEVIPAPEFGGSFIHPGSLRQWMFELSYQF